MVFFKNKIKRFLKKVETETEIFQKRQSDKKKYEIIKNVPENFDFPKVEKAPLVSVIIPVFNQYKHTKRCLYSVLKNTKNIDYEIVLADDCSTDETIKIQEKIKNIKVVKTDKNSGFLKNCNNASKCAKGKYLWFLNNDTQVEEGALSYLLKIFEDKEDAVAVGSKLIFPDKKLQEAGCVIFKDGFGLNYGRGGSPFSFDYNYLKEVDYCSGASLLVEKDLFLSLNGFDERFSPAYYEETDLCFRLREFGKVYYQPKSEVIHFEKTSMKNDNLALINKNRQKFVEKWQKELSSQSTPEDIFRAKDGSQNRKTLLFVDDGILRYDNNCGNRSSLQYLKLFKDLGFNVKFLAIDYVSTLKDKKYEDAIAELGVEIIDSDEKKLKKWVKNYAKNIDYVFVNRPVVWQNLPDFKSFNPKIKVLYQGHDIHYLREKRAYEISGDDKHLKISNQIKAVEEKIWQEADFIYYFSKEEIDKVKLFNKNAKAEVLPLYLLDNNKTADYCPTERSGIIFVGGFSHFPNEDAALWFCKNIFPKVLKKIPEMKLYLVGSNPSEKILSLKSENIVVAGFVEDEKLQELNKKIKLSVVPLRFGAGVKGKIIEALYEKIPVITTKIGAEGIDSGGEILVIADEEQDFAQKLIDLYLDDEKLEEISQKTEDLIRTNFSKEKAIEVFRKQGIL